MPSPPPPLTKSRIPANGSDGLDGRAYREESDQPCRGQGGVSAAVAPPALYEEEPTSSSLATCAQGEDGIAGDLGAQLFEAQQQRDDKTDTFHRNNVGAETVQPLNLVTASSEGPDTAASQVDPLGSKAPDESLALRQAIKDCEDKLLAIILQRYLEKPSDRGFWRYQLRAAMLYTHIYMQIIVAGLICANFLTNVIEKQIDPMRDRYTGTWDNIDIFYNVVFTFELMLNMYGFWFRPFWSSAWNWFDFLVVTIGVLNMAEVQLPGPLSLLRMMRAFRVFRLFKRVKSLNKIIVSIVKAIPGVLNAFLIMIIFKSIYAMLAVQFWQDVGFDENGVCEDKFVSARGNCFGWEYFGDYLKAMFSLFQILTGESWSEAIVRLMLIEDDGVETNIGAGIFFLSFFALNAIVLINVVVAVLLDKMANDSEDAPEDVAASAVEEADGSSAASGQGEKECANEVGPNDVSLAHSPDHLREDVHAIRGDLEEVMKRMSKFEASVQHCVGSLMGPLQQVLTKLDEVPRLNVKLSHDQEQHLKSDPPPRWAL